VLRDKAWSKWRAVFKIGFGPVGVCDCPREVASFVQTVFTRFKVEAAGRYAAVLIAGNIAK
jgi:hypothetical protein